jgi:hypothetical protein
MVWICKHERHRITLPEKKALGATEPRSQGTLGCGLGAHWPMHEHYQPDHGGGGAEQGKQALVAGGDLQVTSLHHLWAPPQTGCCRETVSMVSIFKYEGHCTTQDSGATSREACTCLPGTSGGGMGLGTGDTLCPWRTLSHPAPLNHWMYNRLTKATCP